MCVSSWQSLLLCVAFLVHSMLTQLQTRSRVPEPDAEAMKPQAQPLRPNMGPYIL